MTRKQNAPEIRFEGFTDPWEQRKLGDLISVYIAHAGPEEDVTVLTSSRDGIQKQEDHFGRLQQHDTSDWNLIPYGYCTYRNRSDDGLFTFNVNKVADRGIVSKFYPVFETPECDADFLVAYLNSSQEIRKKLFVLAVGTSQVVLSYSALKELGLLLPQNREQSAIANVLNHIDNLITLHQRKHDKLCTVKKSMLDKMFPKPGETEPEIRFEGFTDPWEQRKLGELADRYKELVPTPRNGYVRMGVRSHAKGTFLTEVEPGQQIEEQELSRVKADNLVVNIVFAWEHAVAITSVDDAKALVSHRFPQFSFHDDMEPGFFRYAILDEAFRWHLWLASPSGAGRNKTLNVGTMLEYEFSVPKKAEQAKIAAFLDRLDDLITLHQRKLELLRNIKKSLLDRMFV